MGAILQSSGHRLMGRLHSGGQWLLASLGLLAVVALTSLVFETPSRAANENQFYLPLMMKADPVRCTSGLDNPSFEYEMACWLYFSNYGDSILSSLEKSPGLYSARLGSNWQYGRTAWISQQMYVPYGRSTLTYWSLVDSQEDYCPIFTRYDYVSFFVNGTESEDEVAWFPLCDDFNVGWLKRGVDLSAYQGMVVNLRIFFKSDITLPSDFYVDDFKFE